MWFCGAMVVRWGVLYTIFSATPPLNSGFRTGNVKSTVSQVYLQLSFFFISFFFIIFHALASFVILENRGTRDMGGFIFYQKQLRVLLWGWT